MSDKREKSLKFTSWEVVRRLLVTCISFVILIGIITLSFYYKEVNRERENFKDREERNVDILKEIITTHLESVVSDLVIISKIKELKEFINIDGETNRGALAKVFLLYSKQKGLYDQIRFINEKGMEIVRINFNDGEPYIVPEDELQDKGKRYYFRDTFGLDRGEAFVSPFDLNIEEGEIEQPLKPMIRLSIPVFDSNGEKRGIVLLNYLGRNLLEHFEWVSASTSAGEVMLLNSDGFWLKSPRREDEWGFMYEDRANLTFGNAFPGAWQEIFGNGSGHFNNTDGLFMFTTFTTIYPLSENMKSSTGSGRAFEPSKAYVNSREFNWKIVSRITPATLYKNPKRLLHKLLLWDSGILVIFTVGSWLLAYTDVKRKQAEVALRKSHDELEIKVEERTRELIKANEELKAANQQLRASEQQLKAANQQLRASEQQLRASNQQLRANEQQLRAEISERKKMEKEREKHLHDLETFYKANIGREERILELKKRIKELEEKQNKK
jgi:hypothetical protein